ncbi:SHOCT domain-containing protein [Agromyces lapidis]|uniref:SHOCT domain-containing protein n=1 Tax=Agromyces lapidis TaxID=279574 RepID=A0ABV5SPH9_9MICO|nr:SHOCT domain-containing protein [Agromyces lapidis]
MDEPFLPSPVAPDPFVAASGAFGTVFVLACLIVAGGIVVSIVLAIRNYNKARSAGHDPFTLQTDLATRALDSELLAPKQTLEQRLAELDDLATRGVITSEERAAARTELLSGR